MPTTTRRRLAARLADRLADRLRAGEVTELPALAELVYRATAETVPYDFACFAVTDPASGVVTWASKTRSLGVGDEEFAAVEYGPPDVNKLEEIAQRRPPVGALWLDTGGHPERCRRHRELMAPRFGFTDELRLCCTSRGTTWAALALYRGAGDPPFTAAEAAEVAEAGEVLAAAAQRALFRAVPPGTGPQDGAKAGDGSADGPAVLVVDPDDRATQLTPAAHAAVEELGGWDHGSLPASVLAVVVTCRTTGAPFSSRVQGRSGRWWSLRAAPLDGGPQGRDVVVTVEATPRASLSRLALAAHGLTAREEDVALLVLQGVATSGIAAALHLSPHTVQDHLKKVFAKVGVTSRRELTAKLVLT